MCDALTAMLHEVEQVTVPCTQEARELGRRARSGDQRAISELVQRNMPMVISLAKRLVRRHGDLVELVQIGAIALWKAAKGYDCDREAFSTYAWPAVSRAMWRSLRQRNRDSVVLDAVSLSLFGGDIVEERSGDHDNVMSIVQELPDRERHIVMRRFGLDGDKRTSTLEELASDLGVSRERVRQIQQRAMNEMRERLSFTA